MGLHHVLCIYVGVLVELLIVGMGVSLTLLLTLGTHFLLLECFVQSLYEDFCLVSFCQVCLFFSEKKQRGSRSGQKQKFIGSGKSEWRETMVEIYCMSE